MEEFIRSFVVVVFAYICGSVPWGYIIGKVNGIDIRTVGSKNIGATNVTRCVGKKAGKLCFALDFLKGLLPVMIARYFIPDGSVTELLVVFAAILGHIFPVFLNFKGGKGVSTAAGAVMALAPIPLVTALVVWVVVFFISRYVSLASITAAAVLPVIAWVMILTGNRGTASIPVAVVLTVIAVLAIFRHRANIQRLLDGTENRFGRK